MKKGSMSLVTKIFIGLGLGVVAGLLLQDNVEFANTYIKPFGTLFLNLLKMIIVPLVFASLVAGVIGIGDISKVGRVGGKSLVYFLGTTLVALCFALTFAQAFKYLHVEQFFSIDFNAELNLNQANSFTDVVLNMVPTNPIAALANGDMLQIIVFALFLGFGILALGACTNVLADLFTVFAEVMYKITDWVIQLTPYAVFALIAPVVASNGPEALLPLAAVIGVLYATCLIHGIITYSVSIKLFTKMSPLTFFKEAVPALLFAFSSTSSAATIPISMDCAKKMGVPLPIRSFVLPLGSTVHMDGSAVYQGICALFIAQVCGVDLTLGQMAMIVLTATLASIGAAGVPGAAIVMLSMVLESVGLPLEGIALVIGIDRILDMARTALNVGGDIACAVIVAATENELDPEKTKREMPVCPEE